MRSVRWGGWTGKRGDGNGGGGGAWKQGGGVWKGATGRERRDREGSNRDGKRLAMGRVTK